MSSREGISSWGADPKSLQGAISLHEQGRYQEALRLYQGVLWAEPDNVLALTYGGAALLEVGKVNDAVAQLKNATRLQPDNAEAHGYLANALQMTGDLKAAETHYQMAVFLDPEEPAPQSNLGVCYHRQGRLDDALGCFRRVISLAPDYAPAHSYLCDCLRQTGDLEAAIDSGRRAIGLGPHSGEAHNNLAVALVEAGRVPEAIRHYQEAVALQPDFIAAHNNLSIALIIADRAADALAALDRCLMIDPGNIQALATKSVALNEVGDREGLDALLDFENLTRQTFIDAPAGYKDLAAFNDALAQHVRTHPSLEFEKSGNATRSGLHSGSLLAEPKGPFADFERLLHQAVEDYLGSLPENSTHPFVASKPSRYQLAVWGLVLTEAGHQVPHIHPTGWLSGCYYPLVPNDIRPSDKDHKGWFEYGEAQSLYRAKKKSPVTPVCPEEGKLILFPAYYFHRTNPVSVAGERISIAFDVLADP
jgi:uncharacterized protein (TIGR02466 family)